MPLVLEWTASTKDADTFADALIASHTTPECALESAHRVRETLLAAVSPRLVPVSREPPYAFTHFRMRADPPL
jgi:hypothetical protein